VGPIAPTALTARHTLRITCIQPPKVHLRPRSWYLVWTLAD